ncbi:MAG: DUF4097 domain-containing protein, partial [Oscillospiraceae bacterium]|nr:DUF4097 domain-containing protein [Oscillospiraceae bacterium]
MNFKEFFKETKEKISNATKKSSSKGIWNYSKHVKIGLILLCVSVCFFSIGAISGGTKADYSGITPNQVYDISAAKIINFDTSYGNYRIKEVSENPRVVIEDFRETKLTATISGAYATFDYLNGENEQFVSFIMFDDKYLDFNGLHANPQPIFNLYLTSNQIESLNIETSYGNVDMAMNNNFTLANLDISSEFGDITVRNVVATRNAEIDSDFGEMDITNCYTQVLDLTSNYGTIYFSGDVYKRAHFECEFGDLKISLERPMFRENVSSAPYAFEIYQEFGELEFNGARSKQYSRIAGDVIVEIESNFGDIEIFCGNGSENQAAKEIIQGNNPFTPDNLLPSDSAVTTSSDAANPTQPYTTSIGADGRIYYDDDYYDYDDRYDYDDYYDDDRYDDDWD